MNLARFIQAKIQRARTGKKPLLTASRERIPPGQRLVNNFPVLDLGTRPRIRTDAWHLDCKGLIQQPQTLDWQAYRALPQTDIEVDIHCVTSWSKLDMSWSGVRTRDLLEHLQPLENARHVILHSADGYTTNVPLELLYDSNVLLAHSAEGKPLSREHGGPVRMMLPARYFWKSAKWLTAMEFVHTDQPGFWEQRAYHNNADPWKEERYAHNP